MMIGLEDHYPNIPKGWRDLVEYTHGKLLQIDPRYKILQIKEKFGGLRYYISTESKRVNDMQSFIFEAEKKSRIICQNCGKDGNSRQVNGWHLTACNDCWEKGERGYE